MTPPSEAQSASRLSLTTADGEHLSGLHLAAADGARDVAVVLAHGFTFSTRSRPVRAVAVGLSRYAGVLALDLRGHGRSSGQSTLGDREVLDVDAGVAEARRLGYRRVVTCGWSMGGAVVLRHAALHRGVDAVVSVSAMSRWYYRGTVPMRRVHWLVERPLGRLIARRALRTRIGHGSWVEVPESPVEVVPLIAPTPLLLVHGDADHYFPLEHPRALAAAAGEPSELWIVPGFGHAENGAPPELVDRIGRHLCTLLAQAA